MKTITELYTLLRTFLSENEDEKYSISKYQFIKNFRTLGLIVPRGVGKTSLINMAKSDIDGITLTFVPSVLSRFYKSGGIYKKDTFSFDEIENPYKFIGLEKIGAIFVDEFMMMSEDHRDNLRNLIALLDNSNKLSDNFFVLKLSSDI